MFKKSEESEWTRFSRALQSQPAQHDDPVEPDEAETVEIAASGNVPAPRDEPAPAAYAQEPAYQPYARPEAAYQRPEATYQRAEPAEYDERQPAAYEEPASAPAAPAGYAFQADSAETVLGEGASLEGTLRSDRSIRVRGFLSGQIESQERVVIEANARVEARIIADQVTVVGEVNGQIECAGRVEIAPTGRVTGEVRTGRLAIQEGAFFQGQLTMVPNEVPAADQDGASGDLLDDGSVG